MNLNLWQYSVYIIAFICIRPLDCGPSATKCKINKIEIHFYLLSTKAQTIHLSSTKEEITIEIKYEIVNSAI